MGTIIRYTLSQAAQRAEIKAGRSGEADRSVDVDLAQHIDDPMVAPRPDGTLTVSLYDSLGVSGAWRDHINTPQDRVLTPEGAVEVVFVEYRGKISADKKEREDQRAKEEAETEAWLALPLQECDQISMCKQTYNLTHNVKRFDPRVVAKIDAVIKMKRDRERAVDQLKQADEQRKIDQLTDVVNRLGSETQKARWVAGVMPRKEVLALLWSEVFAPVKNALPNEYHIDEENTEYDGEIERDETEKKTLTDEQWITADAAAKLLPGAEVSYWHQYYDGRDDLPTCDVARYKLTVGEYALECDVIIP